MYRITRVEYIYQDGRRIFKKRNRMVANIEQYKRNAKHNQKQSVKEVHLTYEEINDGSGD